MSKKKQCVTEQTMDKIRETFEDDPDLLKDIENIKTCSKRRRSAYQDFVSVCLKEGGTIKECAAKWQEKKNEE